MAQQVRVSLLRNFVPEVVNASNEVCEHAQTVYDSFVYNQNVSLILLSTINY